MAIFNEVDYLPEGLVDCDSRALHALLQKPTLIHLQGRHPDPLFVSVLMHGNETVGWDAMRRLLPKYTVAGGSQELPRSLSLFIGNVEAAKASVRALPDQPDYNRIWPGCNYEFSGVKLPEHEMAEQIVKIMRERNVFASIDVHNNTGMNPHYACVNVVQDDFLRLAALFGRTVVFFTEPCQVCSMAMADLCPAVTLECGKVGSEHGIEHAMEYLDACLHLHTLEGHPVPAHDIDLFHTVATVKIPEEITFGFEENDVEVTFSRNVEHLNFRELTTGTYFASVSGFEDVPLYVFHENESVTPDDYFMMRDQDIVFRKPVMPSMLTMNKDVIRQDCLCYLMERYQI